MWRKNTLATKQYKDARSLTDLQAEPPCFQKVQFLGIVLFA